MGLLAQSSKRSVFSRRGGALMLVAGMHVAALAMLINARFRADVDRQPSAFLVSIAPADTPDEPPPDLKAPDLPPPPPVALVEPLIDISFMEISAPLAITVAPDPPPQKPLPPPPPRAMPVQNDAPVMLSVDQVDYVRAPAPSYPRAAKQARLQGTVQLWVLIDAEGRAREVRVHKSSGYEQLDNEACEAVRRALFAPYRHNGVARSAQVIVPIEFTLTRARSGRS